MRTSIAITVLCGLLLGCRTAQRKNVATDNPVTITIRMNGITDDAVAKYKLEAQLKLCADTSGTLATGTTYKFSAHNIKKDTVCQVRLVGPKGSEAGVSFFPGSDDGLYFDATSVTIRQDETGALVADAYMQKHFTTTMNPQVSTWKIISTFKSDTALSPTCTCRLQCQPPIANDAALVQIGASPTDGKCTFDNVSSTPGAAISCNQIVVQCGDKLYAGTWPAPLPADTSAGKVNTLALINVLPATPTPEGDVVVVPEIHKTGTPVK